MMGVGWGPKNFQTWIWDGFSPCLVILVSLRSILVSVLIFWPVEPFILIQTTPCHINLCPKGDTIDDNVIDMLTTMLMPNKI